MTDGDRETGSMIIRVANSSQGVSEVDTKIEQFYYSNTAWLAISSYTVDATWINEVLLAHCLIVCFINSNEHTQDVHTTGTRSADVKDEWLN